MAGRPGRSIPTTPGALMGIGEVSMQMGRLTDSVDVPQALHADLARRAGLRAARPGLFASRTTTRARAMPAARASRFSARRRRSAASRAPTSSCTTIRRRRKSSTPSTRPRRAILDANPPLLYMAAKSYAGANQCTKAAGDLQAAATDDEEGHEGLHERAEAGGASRVSVASTAPEVRHRSTLRRRISAG